MVQTLRTIGWIACVIYATIPSFWLLIHPRVEYWRSRPRSPYRILLPAWIAMWLLLAAVTAHWRDLTHLSPLVVLDSGSRPIRRGAVPLQTLRQRFQPGATRRYAGSSARSSPAATGDDGHSRPRAPSRLSRPSLRDAGLERRHRPRSLLGPDSIRDRHRSRNDQDGRQRTREPLRRRIPPVSIHGARCSAFYLAESALNQEPVAIIRLG